MAPRGPGGQGVGTGHGFSDGMTDRPERPLRIAVVGAASAGDGETAQAYELGQALARLGALVICGGRSGVMQAVARGVADHDGTSVGILPGSDGEAANPWITIPIATGLGEARNALVVRASEAVVAVGGSWGTLSEIALAKKMGLAVAALGEPPADGLDVYLPTSAAEAAGWAIEQAAVYRARNRG